SMGNRRLLATVVVGVVLSAALMASVALYSDAIRDLGLKHQLAEQPPRSLDIEIVSSNHAAEPGLYNDRRDITDDLLDRDAGAIVDEVVRYGRTDTFFLTAPGDQVDREDQQRPRANFQFYEDLLDHV